jgi:hypothetical protein
MSGPNFKTSYPFGKVATLDITAGGTMAATVSERVTHATISEMSAAGTLNVTIGSEVPEGAMLKVRVSADGTSRVLTLGTGLTGNAFTVSAGKSFVLSFVKMGASFVSTSTLQLN